MENFCNYCVRCRKLLENRSDCSEFIANPLRRNFSQQRKRNRENFEQETGCPCFVVMVVYWCRVHAYLLGCFLLKKYRFSSLVKISISGSNQSSSPPKIYALIGCQSRGGLSRLVPYRPWALFYTLVGLSRGLNFNY